MSRTCHIGQATCAQKVLAYLLGVCAVLELQILFVRHVSRHHFLLQGTHLKRQTLQIREHQSAFDGCGVLVKGKPLVIVYILISEQSSSAMAETTSFSILPHMLKWPVGCRDTSGRLECLERALEHLFAVSLQILLLEQLELSAHLLQVDLRLSRAQLLLGPRLPRKENALSRTGTQGTRCMFV